MHEALTRLGFDLPRQLPLGWREERLKGFAVSAEAL